jgi:hypothetical protein
MYGTVTTYARIPNDWALTDCHTLIFRSGRAFLDIAIFRVIGVTCIQPMKYLWNVDGTPVTITTINEEEEEEEGRFRYTDGVVVESPKGAFDTEDSDIEIIADDEEDQRTAHEKLQSPVGSADEVGSIEPVTIIAAADKIYECPPASPTSGQLASPELSAKSSRQRGFMPMCGLSYCCALADVRKPLSWLPPRF